MPSDSKNHVGRKIYQAMPLSMIICSVRYLSSINLNHRFSSETVHPETRLIRLIPFLFDTSIMFETALTSSAEESDICTPSQPLTAFSRSAGLKTSPLTMSWSFMNIEGFTERENNRRSYPFS